MLSSTPIVKYVIPSNVNESIIPLILIFTNVKFLIHNHLNIKSSFELRYYLITMLDKYKNSFRFMGCIIQYLNSNSLQIIIKLINIFIHLSTFLSNITPINNHK